MDTNINGINWQQAKQGLIATDYQNKADAYRAISAMLKRLCSLAQRTVEFAGAAATAECSYHQKERRMGLKLFTCQGGDLLLPDRNLVLVSRQDGGNLVVTPPRDVWERSELTAIELMLWSFLVVATGRAMLEVLPQLQGGCINYWEAGNWALNVAAEPPGAKTAKEYRHVHLHLLGRSPNATDPAWRWGEAPKFPDFAGRHSWAANNERLTAEECQRIVTQVEVLLQTHYGMPSSHIALWFRCQSCGYPTAGEAEALQNFCPECQAAP